MANTRLLKTGETVGSNNLAASMEATFYSTNQKLRLLVSLFSLPALPDPKCFSWRLIPPSFQLCPSAPIHCRDLPRRLWNVLPLSSFAPDPYVLRRRRASCLLSPGLTL